jgi:predicted ferric reductase
MTLSAPMATLGDMLTRTRPAVAPMPVLPRAGRRVRAEDVIAILVANGLFIVAMWVRHGGLDQLGTVAGVATGLGQVTALLGTYFALIQLILMSRAPWLDRTFGRDRLTVGHRWVGFASVWLIVGHGVFTTVGFSLSEGRSVLGEFWTLVTTWDFVLMSVVALVLFVAVAITSVRLARRKLSYETWYGVHLYAYLAIALAFAHQLAVGTDLVDDPMARLYWIGLYVITFGLLLPNRVGTPIVVNLRHRFRVSNVVEEAPGVISVYLRGRDLERFPIRAGQYVVVRFLTDGWWRSHPYSISAQPNGRWLRLTVKALGDDSSRLTSLAIGTRAIVEGPYGNMTGERAGSDRVLMVAGGIGVTPLRALLEELSTRARVTLLYRTSDADDLVFRKELDALATHRGITVHYLTGRRDREFDARGRDPLALPSIRRLVPDIAAHDVYLCGPTGMMETVAATVEDLGVPSSRIHRERFDT